MMLAHENKRMPRTDPERCTSWSLTTAMECKYLRSCLYKVKNISSYSNLYVYNINMLLTGEARKKLSNLVPVLIGWTRDSHQLSYNRIK